MNKEQMTKATILGISSQIPIVSGIVEFFNTYFQEQSEARRDKVEEEFRKKLYYNDKELKEIQKWIKENPGNFAVFLNGVKGAMEDISADKARYYANATFHAIKNESMDNVKVHIFLNLLRRYSVLHIMALQYFSKPHVRKRSHFQSNIGNMRTTEEFIADIIAEESPDLVKDIPLLNIIIKELFSDGLLEISTLENLHNMFLQGFNRCITELGEEFLVFINDTK